MTNPVFQKATKSQSRLRMAIDGPAGSGKTYSALVLASTLCPAGKRVAMIDTERGSASKYANKFDFDVLELETYSPDTYIQAIVAAEEAGYMVLVIDSLSHAWEGEGGALDMHDAATARTNNSFTAWRDVTPAHRKMVDTILGSPCHIIVTMRSKMDYIQTTDERGKTVVRKVGMAPIQRAGMEYEFDIVADMDIEHNLVVSKTRFEELDKKVANKPDASWFRIIKQCLEAGTPAPAKAAYVAPAPVEVSQSDGNGHEPPATEQTQAPAPHWATALRNDGKTTKEAFALWAIKKYPTLSTTEVDALVGNLTQYATKQAAIDALAAAVAKATAPKE